MKKHLYFFTKTGLLLFLYLSAISFAQSDSLKKGNSEIEFIPIINYDTDVGLGYGIKLFSFHQLNHHESFDVIIYNSTKGERWYRFVFSLPDFEYRQGKVYPWAIDLIADYDKWIKYNYFGIGSHSNFSSREQYTREPIEISLILSKGITPSFVAQLGIKYSRIKSYNFSPDGSLKNLSQELNNQDMKYISFLLNLRYDSRDSYINPTKGRVIQLELEGSPKILFTNTEFFQSNLWLQYYTPIIFRKLILAARLGALQTYGNEVPLQKLTAIGGNNTIRGLLQDRYLDKAAILINSEFRFPIFYRLGGIIGLDIGRVFQSLSKINFNNWMVNPVLGLRYYFDKFIVRFDVGYSPETFGIYFNFGQLF
ncbi:outer membrane protein assembly factor BamA [bacterium BMS3Abin03]|nr:outer membrane protein assembly factor BamA [bacterium BMS3Abin03]